MNTQTATTPAPVITFEPLNFGHIWTLEELNHPIADAARKLTGAEISRS